MPEVYQKAFLQAFKKLKQRVLWKYESEEMIDLPPNVKLSKWIPQQDVLGHKNIRMFITKGGLLSIHETVYHGVPVIAIPIFVDQDSNIQRAVEHGFALKLELNEITEASVTNLIHRMLTNSRLDFQFVLRKIISNLFLCRNCA